MNQAPKRRMRGACEQCAKRKRKCDRKHPRCSQCVKQDEVCQARTFKNSTQSAFSQSQYQDNLLDFNQEQESLAASVFPAKPVSSQRHELPSSEILVSDTASSDTESPTVFLGTLPDGESAQASELSSFPGTTDINLTEHPNAYPDPSELGISLGAQQPFLSGNESFSILPEEHNCLDPSSDTLSLSLVRTGRSSPSLAPSSYCPMPWPDDMLASPERRFLWRYFLSIIESEYLCVDWEDVGHLYNFQHPYTTTLPRMAISNAALRGAILCFSASQYELKHKQTAFSRTKAQACSQAVQSMRSQIVQQNEDEHSLLSMIFAASILHYFGTERHNYLRIASNLVPKFLSKWRPDFNSSTTYPEVSLTEFRWGVITSLCSLQQPGQPLDDLTYRMIEMSDREINQKFSQAFDSWVSHPIYMFSPRLINPLLRIGRLLEKQLLRLQSSHSQNQDLPWEHDVTEVEEMLLHSRECDVNVLQSPPGCGDPANVLALNEAMYAACAILLYARIHGVPFTAPFVRRQTQLVVDEISKIDTNSRVSYAIVFPLFVAGCEAVESQVRNAIRERLQNPQGVSYDRGDMIGALDHIWEIRDLRPGLSWPQWVDELEPRYRVSCLM